MTQHRDLQDLMQSVNKKSLELMTGLQQKPQDPSIILRKCIEISEYYQSLIAIFLNNPELIWSSQWEYWQDAYGLLAEQWQQWLQGNPSPPVDKHFSGEAWENHPFFNSISQHYLLVSEHINTLLNSLDYEDSQQAKKIKFFSRQILDALSPANYLYTNPQLLAETLQSHGTNLVKGMQNFLDDYDSDSNRLVMKMTDMDAFTVGENLATTAGKVIHRNAMMELIQYSPQTQKVKSVPLLIIPPWINKYYILDLSPKNSLVAWLVQQGITVFMISWVNPNTAHRDNSLEDYLTFGPLEAIKVIQQQCKVPQVNTLGFCIGGTLQAMLLAYLKAKNHAWVKAATYLATMIDFSDPGDMSVFIDEQQLQTLEAKMDKKGYLDGRTMAFTFNSLRANDLVWSFFVNNYIRGKSPVPFDILYWNADCTNMPAKMHMQYLRWMYLNNDLIKANKIQIGHTPIDVSTIDIPSFFVSSEKDHIAPWKTTYLGFQCMKGPKRFLLAGSGHVAGVINPPINNKYYYHWSEKAEKSPDEWLSQASKEAGSWWPKWGEWLAQQSGRMIEAKAINERPLKILQDAPGRYVFTQCSDDQQSDA